MNKLIPIMLAALAALPAGAKLQGSGYYRVQNYSTTRWIYVIDNRGSLNVATTSADVHAITLWKPLELALYDPASVIYVSGGNGQYNFTAQGTSVHDIIDMNARVKEASGDRYLIYGTKGGITKYLGDGEKGWMDEGYMTDNAKGNERYWYFCPMSTDSPDQYFGIKPDLSAQGENWATMYASFPYSVSSAGVEAMYVYKVDTQHGIAVVKDCPAQVAGGTPVLFRTASAEPAQNRLSLLAPGSGTATTDNLMGGTYFNYLHAQHPNRVAFDAKTMRMLGLRADGKAGFVSTPPADGFIPRNHCWLKVPAGTPAELQIMDEAQYQDFLSHLTVAVESVSLSAASKELTEGDTFQLTATITPDNATDKTVAWITDNASVASVDAKGLVTAVAPGTATITAKAGDKTATCVVTVKKRIIAVDGIALSAASKELTEGDTFQLTATVTPDNATDKTVAWSTDNASVASVDAKGLVTAVAPGVATITAKAGDKTATCVVTVKKRIIAVDGIALSVASKELTEGDTFQLTATVTPDNATDRTVAWSTDNAAVASVDAKGLVTAVAPGAATITAKAGNFAAGCKITVKARYVAVDGITLDRTSADVTEGESFKLTATVSPADATEPAVTWSTDNAAVATVDDQGAVTAVAPGQAVITAKAGGFAATCAVTVHELVIAVESVTLDLAELSLRTGQSQVLTATVLPDDATSRLVDWSSSDPDVATVDATGTVTAVYADGGDKTATITAKAGDCTATCQVTVTTYLPVTAIHLNYHEAEVRQDETLQLTATVEPENHTTPVEWSSADTGVAVVDEEGLVTGVKEGKTVVTLAATGQDEAVSAECEVTVLPQVGIATIGADGVKIAVNGLEIRILGEEQGRVYDAAGHYVARLGQEPVTLASRGVYVIVIGSEAVKVVL